MPSWTVATHMNMTTFSEKTADRSGAAGCPVIGLVGGCSPDVQTIEHVWLSEGVDSGPGGNLAPVSADLASGRARYGGGLLAAFWSVLFPGGRSMHATAWCMRNEPVETHHNPSPARVRRDKQRAKRERELAAGRLEAAGVAEGRGQYAEAAVDVTEARALALAGMLARAEAWLALGTGLLLRPWFTLSVACVAALGVYAPTIPRKLWRVTTWDAFGAGARVLNRTRLFGLAMCNMLGCDLGESCGFTAMIDYQNAGTPSWITGRSTYARRKVSQQWTDDLGKHSWACLRPDDAVALGYCVQAEDRQGRLCVRDPREDATGVAALGGPSRYALAYTHKGVTSHWELVPRDPKAVSMPSLRFMGAWARVGGWSSRGQKGRTDFHLSPASTPSSGRRHATSSESSVPSSAGATQQLQILRQVQQQLTEQKKDFSERFSRIEERLVSLDRQERLQHRSAYKIRWGGRVYLVKVPVDNIGVKRNLLEATALCAELPTCGLWRSHWGKAVLVMRWPRVIVGSLPVGSIGRQRAEASRWLQTGQELRFRAWQRRAAIKALVSLPHRHGSLGPIYRRGVDIARPVVWWSDGDGPSDQALAVTGDVGVGAGEADEPVLVSIGGVDHETVPHVSPHAHSCCAAQALADAYAGKGASKQQADALCGKLAQHIQHSPDPESGILDIVAAKVCVHSMWPYIRVRGRQRDDIMFDAGTNELLVRTAGLAATLRRALDVSSADAARAQTVVAADVAFVQAARALLYEAPGNALTHSLRKHFMELGYRHVSRAEIITWLHIQPKAPGIVDVFGE
eukprot:5901743-Amphidinium_carterae.1